MARRKMALLFLFLAVQNMASATNQKHSRNAKTASQIVIKATRTINIINDFKDDFVQDVLGIDWGTANEDIPSGSVDDVCLPPPPPAPGTYSVQEFDKELVRMYSLLQGYSIALQHLTLDRVFMANHGNDYRRKVHEVVSNMESLLEKVRRGINHENRIPDNEETEKNMAKIYSDVGPERHKRDFAILRDTLDALEHCAEVFDRSCFPSEDVTC